MENVCSDVPFNSHRKLPGLMTTEKFDMNGKSGTWKEHGLTMVTWFAVQNWPSFPAGCNGVLSGTTETITSFPYETDNKTRTEIYYGLFPYA